MSCRNGEINFMTEAKVENRLTSVIIPTFNQWEYTRQCLESIRQFTATSYEIIIVDNGSTDETVTSLKQMDDVILIENDTNKGFPAACNQGLARAKGEQMLLLNNDVVVSAGWLQNLLACLYANPLHGAVGPVTNNISGNQIRPQLYQTLAEFQEFARQFNQSDPRKWSYSLRLVGFCLLIRREIYENVGPFDEQFGKGNFEDDDYSLRIRRAGYKLVIAGDTYIHHFGSVTNRTDPEYQQLLALNRQKFMEKWNVNPAYSLFTREDLAALVPPVNRLLDVGCACGGLGLTLKNNGVRFVAGIEFDRNAAIDAQTVLDQIWVGDAGQIQIPYPDGWFDAIIFADVLEHFADPLLVLQKLLVNLKTDGYVIASIPNIGHAEILYGLLQGNWTYQDAGILDRTHLRFFTLVEIARMFEQVGLQIEFIGMIQDSTPLLDQLIHELETVADQLHIPSYGPSLEERSRTVQYYIRARKQAVN